MELVDFLRARLDRDEEVLDAIDHVQAPAGDMAKSRQRVEAGYGLLDRYERAEDDGERQVLLHVMREAAEDYDDDPDYDEAWRPEATAGTR